VFDGARKTLYYHPFFMINELLQDRASLYVSGAMTAPERENFELILEFHDELRQLVSGLEDVGTAVVVAHLPVTPPAGAGVKLRLMESLDSHPRQTEPDGVVVTGPDGLIEWVNPAFTAMCGYSLEELRGRKPGQVLQGPETDPASVQRIREAVRDRLPCRETLANYHKDGTVYRVNVAITPILDDAGMPLWFVARERELKAA